jgi:hypothetical protein
VPVVRSKTFRRVAALAVASASVMLAAACGGGGTSSGKPEGAPGNGGGPNNAAFTAYTDCLKKNGVTITMPSGGPRTRPSGGVRPSGNPRPRPSGSAGARQFPGGGGGFFGKPAGVDDATWQKAQAACASVRPSFGGGQRGGGGRNNGASQAYFNCLRDHGVQMGQGQRLSSADPATKKALDACEVLRPTASPAPTS